MGINLPQGRTAALSWIEGHLTDWNDNFAAIGLTSASVIELSQSAANSRQSFTSVEQIRSGSLAATQDFYEEMDATHKLASEMISTIKAFAESTDTPAAVYLLANITGKNPPSPVAPPAQPLIEGIVLNSNGSVTVNFDGTGPTGTVYLVRRKNAGETNYSLVGNATPEDKSFTDTTVPAGTTTASYTVQAVRGADESPLSAAVIVQFGATAGQAQAQAA